MKLVKGIIAAAVMAVACVGGASATTYYDQNSSLMMSVYNPTSGAVLGNTAGPNEVGASLADLSTFQLAYNDNYTLVATNVFKTSDFTGVTSLSQLSAAIYGYVTAGYGAVTGKPAYFFATTTTDLPAISKAAYNAFSNSVSAVGLEYSQADLAGDGLIDGDIVKVSTNDTNSYWASFDSAAAAGKLAGLNKTVANNEAVLSDSGDVYMYLWESWKQTVTNPLVVGSAPVAKIKITSNGDVFVTSAVPVPGAVWLLGSALLGAVGLRRKNA